MRNSLKKVLPQFFSRALLGLALLTGLAVQAQPTMKTMFGGLAGYTDGDSTQAKFRSPSGITMDYSGQYLLVADRSNNVVRVVNLLVSPPAVWTFGIEATNLVSRPISVAVNGANDVTILNRGLGTNGSIYTFNSWGETIFTNALKLTNAAGMAVDRTGNIYVTAQSNRVFKIDAGTTNRTTVATVAIAGVNLQGLVVKNNGLLAVCDSGRHGIYLINPTNGVVTTNSGFHGAGDFVLNGNNLANANQAKFNQPMNVVETGNGSLVVSDYGNHRYKVILPSGVVSNLCGVSSTYWNLAAYPPNGQGGRDGSVKIPDSVQPNVESRQPMGMVLGLDGTLYVTESFWHVIRKVTTANLAAPIPVAPPSPTIESIAALNGAITLSWSTVVGATNYYVKRSQAFGGPYSVIASTSTASYSDTNIIAGATYFYVVSAANAAGESPDSAEVSASLPLQPVATPQIGYVDYPATQLPIPYTSRFNLASSVVLNNDAQIVIVGEAGSQTFYTYGNGLTNSVGVYTNPPTPTISNSASAPSGYADGLSYSQVISYAVAQVQPNLVIKAIGKKSDGSPDSAVAQARFQFVVGNPVVTGANAAAFTVSDITIGSHLYYTTDGSDPDPSNPTNPPVDLGVITSSTNILNLSLAIQGDTLFKIRAFKANYQPSAVVVTLFTMANYQPNTISFGFVNGEASSSFIAAPGQYFYAPVTLSLVGSPTIMSLQFNLVVTNGGPNPAATRITNYGFSSLLLKPAVAATNVNGPVYTVIPPLVYAGSGQFTNGIFNNTSSALLGVGWLERVGQTNLFNSTAQDLITFSQAHDTLFPKSGGKTILGGYSIKIPQSAPIGSTYEIRIGRPSATSDGIGANGSSVTISALTNGGYSAGTLNAIKHVTVGQFKYVVGSAYPFRWFNAGDFGSSNLVSADVMQVFQSAIYQLNTPPVDETSRVGNSYTNVSDFYDTMDSCGNIGAFNFAAGYYTNSNTKYLPVNPLFDGSDTDINRVAFGDGELDVCDVYVTFRRSLDPGLTWFRRYWENGRRVADTNAPNIAPKLLTKKAVTTTSTVAPKVVTSSTSPQVNFTAGDVIGSAGQTVQIPITATILGSYPLRALMLNLTVVPLDGSPAISAPVSFTQSATVLGTPYTTGSKGNGNYSAVWLNTANAGLTGTVTIGYLNVTIPAGAGGSGAYAVRFDHASASPNGLASFADQTLTGVLTTSVRTNSSLNDGIPDTWRMRWFGTVNNALSASNACPTGDGVNNYKKFVAGVDPNVAGSFPSVNKKATVPAGYTAAIHWPSVQGKKYAIERSTSLFNGSWSVLTTNTGTGADMGYDDTTTNKVKFYRVRIVQ